MTGTSQIDVAIAGGGIAGLWLLDALTRAGYSAALFEAGALGGGQTIHSQGIIHSGAKYALGGKKTKNQELLRQMPDRWLGAADGHNAPDLSDARIASPDQYLAFPRNFLSFAVPFAARQLLADIFSPVKSHMRPAGIETTGFRGPLVRLAEPVFDVPSVISIFANRHRERIRQVRIDRTTLSWDTKEHVHRIGSSGVDITARWLVATAGGGIGALAGDEDAAQERPLHMALLKGDLPEVWLHADVAGGRPALTISSHRTQAGHTVWYLGGDIAEIGVDMESEPLLAETRRRIGKYFPALPTTGIDGATVRISRWESATKDKNIPDGPVVRAAGMPNTLLAWPTKLAYAPMLADAVIDRLDDPAGLPEPEFPGAPPPIAPPPWETADWRALP